MDNYCIKYELDFKNLDLYIPGEWLNIKEIATFEEEIETCMVKYVFYNPTISDKNDIEYMFDNYGFENKPRIVRKRFDGSPISSHNNAEAFYIRHWKQIIDITFSASEEIDVIGAMFCGDKQISDYYLQTPFMNKVHNKLITILNNYLLILADKLTRANWDIPYFKMDETETIININSDNPYVCTETTLLQNGQELDLLFSYFPCKVSYTLPKNNSDIVNYMYNVKTHSQNVIKTFREYNHNSEYKIPLLREILLLAEYEKRHYRFKPALLLMAMAVEISIKTLIKTYGNDLHQFLLKKLTSQLEPYEYLEKVIQDIINQQIDIIKTLEIDKNKFKKLFQIRNKIVHEGELYYISNSGKKIHLDNDSVNEFLIFSKDFIEKKVPKIEEMIKNKSLSKDGQPNKL